MKTLASNVGRSSCWLLFVSQLVLLLGCDRTSAPGTAAELPDEPSPYYRNIQTATAYVSDEACTSCHADAASAYQPHAMARQDASEGPLAPQLFSFGVVHQRGK